MNSITEELKTVEAPSSEDVESAILKILASQIEPKGTIVCGSKKK